MSADMERRIERLGHVCAMLTSPNEGERANAAFLASRMLNSFDLDWREFVRRALMAQAEAETPQDAAGSRPKLYSELLEWPGLNDWERSFLESLRERGAEILSEKQEACLLRIMRRYNSHRERDRHER